MDTAVIVAVVVLNALIGFIQEGKAEAALEAVRNLLSLTAAVQRDGRRLSVAAETLVPGDIVLLQSGDKVPADLRLVEVRALRIDESVLTGESVPVEKSTQTAAEGTPVADRTGMAYSGTLVTYGQALAVVAATGSATEIGRLSVLLAEVSSLETPLLRKIDQFARWLTLIILGAAAATFLFGWLYRGLGAEELFMAFSVVPTTVILFIRLGNAMPIHLKRLFDYFLIGVLSVVPILVVVQIVVLIERLLRDTFLSVHGYYENYVITALLFAITIAALTFFGYRIRHGKTYVMSVFEAYVERIPLLSTVYRVTKKLIGIFSGDSHDKQRDVVYVEYPKDGIWVPAYVTNRIGELYVLYIPTSPNPTSGFTVMVHESKVLHSTMTFEDASSFVISVGVDFPKAADAADKLLTPRR